MPPPNPVLDPALEGAAFTHEAQTRHTKISTKEALQAMSASFWRLTVRSEFSASHALRHYQGKCENTHGHNFSVEAVVQGDTLSPDTELLADFSDLKRDLKQVLNTLDHKDLNATPPFDRINPSSENLSRHIFKALAPLAEGRGVRLHSVTVSEKAAQSATYMEA